VFALSTGGIENLNHLFPILQQRMTWPETGREIILCGTMGQVPNFEKPQFLDDEGRYRNPIRETLAEGSVEIGFEIARAEGIKAGDSIVLNGEAFEVHRVHQRRGNDDDITLWCDLDVAQRWFDKAGLINGILALECVCDFQQFGMVEAEVRQILPDTQVMEFGTILRARFDARARAAELHESAVDAELAYRAALGAQRHRLVRLLIPVVLLGAAVWVFFLILNNVKERQGEIAIMRAVGVPSRSILGIFLIKAALMGFAGAVVGSTFGVLGGAVWEGFTPWTENAADLVRPIWWLAAVVGASALTVLAGWLPARKAAQLDPALILRSE